MYTNWAPGEPNDDDGTQNCVRMYGEGGMWDDYLCDNSVDDQFVRQGYICKARAGKSPTNLAKIMRNYITVTTYKLP